MANRVRVLLVVALLMAAAAIPDDHEKRDIEDRSNRREKRQISDIRLVGGTSPTEGRVEVRNGPGAWGTVCDDWWETEDAEVACRMLGFSGGEAVKEAAYGQGTGSIFLDNVECSGSEQSLWDCERNGWGEHNCEHSEDAGVICVGAAASNVDHVDVRLGGSTSPTQGRVEINYNGRWGTICDDWWEDRDAAVVCRQLGFSGGEEVSSAGFGAGTGPIWMDSVTCHGAESNIAQCVHDGWGEHDCEHSEDAGVICEAGGGSNTGGGEPTNNGGGTASLRLMDGRGSYEGRVEILHDGEWGTVCDDAWDDNDATVVCHSLGYDGGVAREDNEFGEGVGTIWLDEVKCWGGEVNLESCRSNDWGDHNCNHHEDAGVVCS